MLKVIKIQPMGIFFAVIRNHSIRSVRMRFYSNPVQNQNSFRAPNISLFVSLRHELFLTSFRSQPLVGESKNERNLPQIRDYCRR